MPTAAIPVPPFDGFDLGFTEIRIYGLLIATAVLVAASWTRSRYEGFGGDGELADRVTIWAVVIAFLGARGAYVLPRIPRFVDDPLGVFQVWEGGLALFGGLTLGLVTLVVLMRRWGGDFAAFMDSLAPALPLAQAIGRLGNYFNQELYGTPSDLPWAVVIEPQLRVAPYEGFSTFHPAFLYEALANLLVMGVILELGRSRRMRKGTLIMVYAIGYGIVRFGLELIRTDTTFRLFGLSRNGLVSLVIIVAGLGLLWWRQRDTDVPLIGQPVAAPAAGPASDEPDEASAVLVGVTEPEDHDRPGPDKGREGEEDPDDWRDGSEGS